MRIIPFWTRQLRTLSKVLILSSQTLSNTRVAYVLWWSWCHAFASVFRFLHLVSTIFDISRPQFAHSIESHKFLCQARALLLPFPQGGKVSASMLIYYFSSHPAAFGFHASFNLIPFWILPIRGQISLSHFQTGISAAADATLDTEQLISHTRTAPFDTVTSTGFWWWSDCSFINAWMTKIYKIVDSSVSKQIGNMAYIAVLPISLIVLPSNIMKSQLPSFSFFTVLRIPFLLVRLAWTVMQSGQWHRLQQYSIGLSQSSTSIRRCWSQAKGWVMV